MSTPITPKAWLENTLPVIAAQALLINNIKAAQLDLTAYAEAILKVDIARISTTAYAAVTGSSGGPRIAVKRLLAEANKADTSAGSLAGSAGSQYATNGGKSNRDFGTYAGLTASGSVTRQVNTTTALGDTTVSLKTSNAGTTAYGSTIAFLGSTAPGSLTNGQAVSTFEVAETRGFSGSGPWTHSLAAPLGIVHTANDYATDAVETFEIRLPGGFVYNVEIDTYSISAGAGAVIQAIAVLNPGWQSG